MARANREEVVGTESPDESMCISVPTACVSIARKTRKPVDYTGQRVYRYFTQVDRNKHLSLYELEHRTTGTRDWEKWRASLDKGSAVVIGGSSFAALLGLSSHTSADRAMQQVLKLVPRPEDDWYAKEAKKHGKYHEKHVIDIEARMPEVFNCRTRLQFLRKMPDSTLYRLENQKLCLSVLLCASPDVYTEYFSRGKIKASIGEIKCPYYKSKGVQTLGDFISDVRARNNKRYQRFFQQQHERNTFYGTNSYCPRPDYMAQAMFYCWLNEQSISTFDINTGYFIRGIGMVEKAEFEWEDRFEMVNDKITGFMAHIMEYIAQGDYTKRYVPPQDAEEWFLEYAQNALLAVDLSKIYETFIDGSVKECQDTCTDSEEESEDQSGDERPKVPREESF